MAERLLTPLDDAEKEVTVDVGVELDGGAMKGVGLDEAKMEVAVDEEAGATNDDEYDMLLLNATEAPSG